MSVIIRLQNLPWSANALDIRQHFQGLSIPEGGVHIVGGEQGDAFIAFSTDEDARQAMMTDGGKIKEVKLKLMLSSRTEMQKVIEQARQQSVSLQNLLQMPAPPIVPTPAPVPVVVIPPPVAPEPPKLPERRDSDTLSNSSKDKDRRNDRKDRSRSRDRDRNRRDKDRRRRSRSRNRRRRSRDRSRDRSKERERSKDRDRKRTSRDQNDARLPSRDRTDPKRDLRRGSSKDDNKNGDQNGSGPNKQPLLVNPMSASSVWAIPPGPTETKPMGFMKASVIPNRSTSISVPAEINIGRGDMDGRRIMGSGPLPTGTMRPVSTTDVEPVGPFQSTRDSWQSQVRPPGEIGGRFPPMDRPGGFMGMEPIRPQGFGNEGSDFDGRGDFLPRGGGFRGGHFRGNPDIRRTFPQGRLGAGPGNILGPPGTMHRPSSFPRGPPGDQFPHAERFEPYPNRAFVSDKYGRGSENRSYDPRVQSMGCCVEIRNIPLDLGYSDIRKFFTGLYVANNAIKIINDNKGHRVGIAYMRFANLEAKDRAIKLTGKQMRGSVVEILHLEDEIFDKAIDSFKPDVVVDITEKLESRVNTSCLQIQDLPLYAKESDIYKLFPKFAVAEVVFSTNEERKQTIAYVRFVRAEDAKAALYSSTKHMVGNTHVKVTLCGLDQLQSAKNRPIVKDAKDKGVNGSPVKDPRSRVDTEPVAKIPIGIVTDCILLKGLPYQTNDRDLLDFFSDVALVPLRIHIMLDNFNKPSGDAYCEFSSYEETIQACTKNNTMLGKQEVTVKPVLRGEMLEALGLPMQPELGPPKHMMGGVGGPRLPFNRNFGRPMGILGNGPRMHMMGRPMGPNPMMGPGGPMGPPLKDAPIEGFGKPGCVVALENIPFRAEVDEILELFSDFDVTRENIIRRFNDVGMATGDARVSFLSPSEAQRAVRELRGVQIRGRPIYLSVL